MRGKKLLGFVSDFERRRGEVIADFQQFYGIPLPIEGDAPDLGRMSLLWAHLPSESRTARAVSPSLEWGTDSYLLWQIEFQLRNLTWALTYDKKHPAPKPQPLPNPAQMAEAKRRRDSALSRKDEITRMLGLEGVV